MGIIQTDPCQSCRYPMMVARTGLPLFRSAKGRRLRLFLRSRDNSVREPNAQPAPATGLFKGFGTLSQQAKTDFRRLRRKSILSICGNKRTACYNGDTPKNGGDGRPMQRPTPKLQWEGTGLTRHCLSCHARLRKLSAGPPIAAFDLRRLRSGQHRTLVSHSKLNR